MIGCSLLLSTVLAFSALKPAQALEEALILEALSPQEDKRYVMLDPDRQVIRRLFDLQHVAALQQVTSPLVIDCSTQSL